MKVISSDAIILRQRDFRDRDRMITFLTRDKGKLTGIAKGAKIITGRGVGVYEPMTRGRVFYVESRSSDLVAIRKCDPIPPYLHLANDYDKFIIASYITELAEICTGRSGVDEQLFELLAKGLQRISEYPTRSLPLLRLAFELNFLRCQGFQPEWSHCLNCGATIFTAKDDRPQLLRQQIHQFDPSLGGILCPDCRAEVRGRVDLAPGTLAFFAKWRDTAARIGRGVTDDPSFLSETHALDELERAVTAHIVHHLERRPRSLSLLPVGTAGGDGRG